MCYQASATHAPVLLGTQVLQALPHDCQHALCPHLSLQVSLHQVTVCRGHRARVAALYSGTAALSRNQLPDNGGGLFNAALGGNIMVNRMVVNRMVVNLGDGCIQAGEVRVNMPALKILMVRTDHEQHVHAGAAR